jgi:hypothetical protein
MEGVGGKGREMTQTLYAHMHKIKIKKKYRLKPCQQTRTNGRQNFRA